MQPRRVRLPLSGGVTLGTKATQLNHYDASRTGQGFSPPRHYRLGSSHSTTALSQRHGSSQQMSRPSGGGGMEAASDDMSVIPGETAMFRPGGKRSALGSTKGQRLTSSTSVLRSTSPEAQYPQHVNVSEVLNSTFDKVADTQQYKLASRSQRFLSGRSSSEEDVKYAHREQTPQNDPPYSPAQSQREERASLATEAKRWAPTQRSLATSISASRAGSTHRKKTRAKRVSEDTKGRSGELPENAGVMHSSVRNRPYMESTLMNTDSAFWEDGIAKESRGRRNMQTLANGMVSSTRQRKKLNVPSGEHAASAGAEEPSKDFDEEKGRLGESEKKSVQTETENGDRSEQLTGLNDAYLQSACEAEIKKARQKFSDLAAFNHVSAKTLIRTLQRQGVTSGGASSKKDTYGRNVTVVDKGSWYNALKECGMSLTKTEANLLFLGLNPSADSRMDVRQVNSLFKPSETAKIDPAQSASEYGREGGSKKFPISLTREQMEEFKREYYQFFDTRGRVKGYGTFSPEALQRLGKAQVDHPSYISAVTTDGRVIFDDKALEQDQQRTKQFEEAVDPYHRDDYERARDKLKEKLANQEGKCVKLFKHFDTENRGFLTQDQFVSFCGETGLCLALPANQMKALLENVTEEDHTIYPHKLIEQSKPARNKNPGDQIDEYFDRHIKFYEEELEEERKCRESVLSRRSQQWQQQSQPEEEGSRTRCDSNSEALSQSIDFQAHTRELPMQSHAALEHQLHPPHSIEDSETIGKPTWTEEEIQERSRRNGGEELQRSGSVSFISGSEDAERLRDSANLDRSTSLRQGAVSRSTSALQATSKKNSQDHVIHRNPGQYNNSEHELKKNQLYSPGLMGVYKAIPSSKSSLSRRTRKNLRSSGVDSVASLVSENKLDNAADQVLHEASANRVARRAKPLKPPDLATELSVTGRAGTEYYSSDKDRMFNKRASRAPTQQELATSGAGWKREIFNLDRSYAWDQPGNPQIGTGDGMNPIDEFTQDQRKDRASDMQRRMERQRRKEANFKRTMETYAKEEEERSLRDKSNIWNRQYQQVDYMKRLLSRLD
eukprot:gb/GECG01000505.1/.p1 GENE.gb/GECG01000505.1/~~gb/GECG01000505.1/.p1  ORF type:complete len:1067 (+),score=160.79 gb/GECG01000505.1/:1-3201(+)